MKPVRILKTRASSAHGCYDTPMTGEREKVKRRWQFSLLALFVFTNVAALMVAAISGAFGIVFGAVVILNLAYCFLVPGAISRACRGDVDERVDPF